MADLKRLILSGSTNGRGIKVAAIATPGTSIHVAHATFLQELWIWASNPGATARALSIEFGGTTSPDDIIKLDIPALSGALLVVPGLVLTGGVTVRAFAAAANELILFGHANQLAQN